ncbi:hypothetical protein HFP15_08115 [Amycolatopsis sp. K13G38]|uniref:Uncharacterized protein n=1 Tax=Amycolatopsis acididurans TaxID=2724524 RepID=A0ABX1IZ89_9PSEU|nr:hypothetical protein [Amycolatopsis acididurans]NKQ52845.1 hypothetical protein [Amycolatopsis acididurans]
MTVSAIFTSAPLSLSELDPSFSRADIEFHGIDHSGASYEGRVFLNNPAAGEDTPETSENGYAGSFHIFGHGGCFGDEGHCLITPRRTYDPRPPHHLTAAKKTVIATEAIARLRDAGIAQVTVTVVPVIAAVTNRCGTEDVLGFDRVALTTYR